MRSKDHSNQQGIVLVSVLWVIVLSSLLVTTFNRSVRTNVTVTRTELDLAKLERIGDAGIELAIAKLRGNPGERWRADGSIYSVRFAGADLNVRVFDTNGLVDINHASSKVLAAALSHLTQADQLASRIHDHIMVRRKSAAQLARAGQNRRGTAQNGEKSQLQAALAFRDVSQLLDQIPMTVAQSRILRRFLTVHSSGSGINPLTMPVGLLQGLPDISSFELAELLKARQEDADFDGEALSGAEYSNEEGPAYTIVIEVSDGSFAKPIVGSATIMTDEENRVPYFNLARRPFGS
ncbi:MAG: general secretion pathway protein GspK [Hyphomicrobiaceae bacterium]